MKIGRKILLAIIALAVFAGTVVLEAGVSAIDVNVVKGKMLMTPSEGGARLNRNSESVLLKKTEEFVPGDVIETADGQTISLSFAGNGVLRLAPKSKLTIAIADTVTDEFVFRLDQGSVWINTAYTSATVNLLAGSALLVPRMAAFNTSFNGSQTVTQAYSGQVAVGLIKPDFASDKAVRFNSNSFINSFLVAQGSQATISQDNVVANADILQRLLYSKLIKEFQYTLFVKADFARDAWLATNVKLDKQLLIDVAAAKLKMINARGLKTASLESWGYEMQKAVSRFADVFTFSAKKVESRLIASLFDYLYDAEYLLVYSRSTEAKQRLDLFSKSVADEIGRHGKDFRDKVMSGLRSAYAELVHVMPEDPLFVAKTQLSDLIFSQLGESDDDITEKFSLIREYINYAYRLADSNVILSRIMLRQYFTKLKELISKEKARLLPMKTLIAEENQIVDNLLKQYSEFYQPEFFKHKYDLEMDWLSLLPDGNEKLEEKQSIINTKIDFLHQLQIFFLNEKIVLADAKNIVTSLLSQIEDLKTGVEVAVNQLFDLRLKDNTKFLYFITSAQQGALKGVTMKQKYESFLAIQKEDISMQKVMDQAKSGIPATSVVETLSAKDILARANGDFAAAGITNVVFGNFTGPEQKLITVEKAQVAGVVFAGQYDWNKKLISNVTVRGKVVSQQPVRLENLGLIIKPAPVVTQQTQETQVVVPVSRAEKVARLLLIQKLKNNGFTLLDVDIQPVDVENGLFIIKKAMLTDAPTVFVSLHFNSKANIASKLVVMTESGNKAVDGDIALADLLDKVKAVSGV